jgi:integrase
MPAVRGGRDRIADPTEAAALIDALPLEDRALWATAFYAGLRRGELQALRWSHVDLAAGVLHVQHGWDEKEGQIATKGKNRRRVPIASVLRDYLLEHRLRSDRDVDALVFGVTPQSPFRPDTPQREADAAWKQAGLERITLHEGRHTAASLYIAAGVNAKALSTFLGHSSITVTIDRYGHLMPGSEEEAAGLLDSYLTAERKRAERKARKAGGDLTGAQSGAQGVEIAANPHG